MSIPTAPQLYPNMPETETDQSYRLRHIADLQHRLETERDSRATVYKKYRRAVNVIDGIDTGLAATSLGLGAGGIALLSTVIAAPIVVILEMTALGCGILSVAGKFVSRRLSVKVKKHSEIRVLASSKLDTIADHVSHALVDGVISDQEFKLILDEVEKYNQLKEEIRTTSRKIYKAKGEIDEKTKQELISRGKEEARESILKNI